MRSSQAPAEAVHSPPYNHMIYLTNAKTKCTFHNDQGSCIRQQRGEGKTHRVREKERGGKRERGGEREKGGDRERGERGERDKER